jgi:ribosome-associated translation inhibitor RaiA
MRIDTHAHGFTLTEGLLQHVQRRLRFAFDRIGQPVSRVSVRLADINAGRGGVDKRCRLQLQVPGRPDVTVEDVQPDLYVAIARAVDRAARSLGRRSSRLRQRLRRDNSADRPQALFSRWPSEFGSSQ